VKFEENGFQTYEQSESGEFFERWYNVSVSLFSNVRSDKKVFKKIYKKDMEKKMWREFFLGFIIKPLVFIKGLENLHYV